ncbi:hypothetical protein N7492_008043 [Penicillium capsulatum]|uniref:non-specific serine/threonine protein kinase n=1 Tax=Penicillium capsulatum TaxID=69766 RepID=A0A9W9HRU4_9EURO|nr:hypothetical protein N7492_008043 [Penicillium capsulatum]KAJ6105452.1 hypothetical protein N7512_008969 [Penicillium capsulatum]
MPAPSPFTTHAPPMQSSKPTTRTVAQRKVYGKRRNNAARAVFEENSPSRKLQQGSAPMDDVDVIQAKLAEVTIDEDSVSPKDETQEAKDVNESELERQPLDQSSHPHTPNEPIDTDEQPVPGAQSDTRKNYERMVEVRISSKKSRHQTTKSSEMKEHSSPGTSPTSSQYSEQEQKSSQSPEKRTRKNAARRSSGYVHNPKPNTYVRPILNEALSSIASQNIQKFSTWASRSATMFHVTKLAEGSYGEVYKLNLREENSRPAVSKSKLAKLRAYGDGVFKIVPLRAQSGPGSKKFTSIDEIVSEVKMLKYLDPIPGFARFREIHVVQGRFPASFQSAWDYYKETKDDCLNPDPSNKKAYPDTQLWAIIEMDDAGCELEKFCWSSVFQIYDIFWGVAMALARAEEYALFEHRDLHLGNVCIRSTRADGSMVVPTNLDIARQSSPSGFGIGSLETTIIDYSLSRADLRVADLPDYPSGVVEIASSDLDKKQIFDAIGQDDDEILLRDTYRHMRATLYTGNPAETQKTEDIPGIWTEYAPRTNLVWLLFILKNLLKNRKPEPAQQHIQATRNPLAPCSPNRKLDKQSKETKSAKTHSGDSDSALVKDRYSKDLHARAAQLKQTMENRLLAVLKLLDFEHGHEDMCCAADLVAYAMDSGWLAEQDFF